MIDLKNRLEGVVIPGIDPEIGQEENYNLSINDSFNTYTSSSVIILNEPTGAGSAAAGRTKRPFTPVELAVLGVCGYFLMRLMSSSLTMAGFEGLFNMARW